VMAIWRSAARAFAHTAPGMHARSAYSQVRHFISVLLWQEKFIESTWPIVQYSVASSLARGKRNAAGKG